MNSNFQNQSDNSILRSVIGGLGLLAISTPAVLAQEPVAPTASEVAELRQQVQDLTKMVRDLQQHVGARPATAPLESPAAAPRRTPKAAPKADSTPDSKAATVAAPDFATSLQADPLPPPKQANSSIFNPEISAAIDMVGSYSASAANVNFTVRDIELMVQSNIDQLAHAYIVFNAESELDPWTKTDPFGEVSLGVEEAAIETTALPYGLAVKAGQFFADFSRLGKVHSHELPFTDRPAGLVGIIGGESKARGLELSWVPPVDQYMRLTLGAVDNIGAETAATGLLTTLDGGTTDLFDSGNNRSFSDLTAYARAATVFELGDRTTLNLGIDYARGQDQGTREMASADFKLTWLPDPASFDRLEVGGEILHGKASGVFGPAAVASGGPVSGNSTAAGAYLYAQYRIGKSWEPCLRYDWFRPESWTQTDADADGIADGMTNLRQSQSSLSAYLNYHLSEFNRLRLGVSYLQGADGAYASKDNDWLGFLQWSIILGPHKHSFQP